MTSAEGFNTARPDGRWGRVLRACAERPLGTCEIHRTVRRHDPDRTGRMEKRKTLRAIRHLKDHGLLRWTAWGFVATPEGEAALALARNPETSPCP